MRKTLIALSLVALIGSINVTEYINSEEARAREVIKTEVTEEETEIAEPMDSDTEQLRYAGNFKLTFYCPCTSCCGPNAQGITASGTVATEGRTVSADPSVLPLGTHIYIEGLGEYVVEDTGSAIKGSILDVFLNSHDACLQRGIEYRDVYIIAD